MTLPTGSLSRSAYDFKGQSIQIRSLTRAECFHIKQIETDLEESEIWMLQCGTDSTREQVVEFRNAEGDSKAINDLIEAIADLSGIYVGPVENGSGPKG